MFIKYLHINNYRNIDNCIFEPTEKINIICGDNAQGKTNLIESIYYASIFKSFRTNKNNNLIKNGSENLNIELIVTNNGVDNRLKVNLDRKNFKKITLNNKNPDSYIYKNLNTIIYYPDEISLLKNNPSYRRNIIDKSIFFINNEYINIYRKYIKCLKQRNIFLKNKNIEKNKNTDVWRDQLIEYGFLIINERTNYIARINNIFKKLEISKKISEIYTLKYEDYGGKNIKDELLKKFEKNRNKELKYGYSLAGPHLENFNFYINNNDINKYSSEGQKRSLLLSYKQAQLLDYKEHKGFYPILLLDDIGTELDDSRRNNIYNKLLADSGQVFITTINLPNIALDKTAILKVENGIFSKFIFD